MEYNFKISEIKLEGRILKRKLKTVMVNNKANLNNMNNYLPTQYIPPHKPIEMQILVLDRHKIWLSETGKCAFINIKFRRYGRELIWSRTLDLMT